jgi:hypothetical protein
MVSGHRPVAGFKLIKCATNISFPYQYMHYNIDDSIILLTPELGMKSEGYVAGTPTDI